MHCRPSCPTNNSSFLFSHSDCTNTLNHCTCSCSSCHNQIPIPRRRRRLEEPVIIHASNYYVTNHPRQKSPSLETPPLLSPRRIRQKSVDKNIYCDLFNLLERPPPVKSTKKYTSNDSKSSRGHQSIIRAKIKDTIERKRHQKQQYEQLEEEEDENCIYPKRLSTKGFFRRIVRNYFCMPMTIIHREFLN
jgi:hypothetical protein